jgi:CheY-like chemotaxis protein
MPPDPEADLAGLHILVVDDDVRNLFAITSLLERYGIEVIPSRSAREAFTVLERRGDIDMVFMDIMMPEMDGYEATTRLRNDERYRNLPVLALTAKAMPGDREKCEEAGCTDFVPKPVDARQLVAAIRRWLPKPGKGEGKRS